MNRILNHPDIGKLILRVGIGLMMLVHGWPKLMKIINGDWGFANPIGLGMELSLIFTVLAEVGCSILLIIGFKTRLASIPLLFTMLVGGLIVHAPDAWDGKEKAFLFALVYLVIMLIGPGKYSIDRRGK